MTGIEGGLGHGWYYKGKHYTSTNALHDELHREVEALEQKLETATAEIERLKASWVEMNKQRQDMIRAKYNAELQVESLKALLQREIDTLYHQAGDLCEKCANCEECPTLIALVPSMKELTAAVGERSVNRDGDTYPNCKEPGCCGNPKGEM